MARLIRLPNVFTAPPDVLVGWVLWSNSRLDADVLWVLVASVCLYAAGMILNDWFDAQEDRRDRPYRPLPAGEVSVSLAFILGAGLLTAGVLIAWFAWPMAGMVAFLLAGLILLYNGLLKKTPIASLAMGGCRTLNVLLGVVRAAGDDFNAVVQNFWSTPAAWVALANGLYITGVTLFARQEAKESSRPLLLLGGMTWLSGMACLVGCWIQISTSTVMYFAIGVIVAIWIGVTLLRAYQTTKPKEVQIAIKTMIFGLVVCNGVSATAAGSPLVGLVIILHLVPAYLLGRWLYST
jgi:4-hydroxybenzoate polyprenyltransferase